MADQIKMVDDKIEITKLVTTEVVETFTKEQIENSIVDFQNQIVNLQNIVVEKQQLLTHFKD